MVTRNDGERIVRADVFPAILPSFINLSREPGRSRDAIQDLVRSLPKTVHSYSLQNDEAAENPRSLLQSVWLAAEVLSFG